MARTIIFANKTHIQTHLKAFRIQDLTHLRNMANGWIQKKHIIQDPRLNTCECGHQGPSQAWRQPLVQATCSVRLLLPEI